MKISNHYIGLSVLLFGMLNLGANGCGAVNGTGCNNNNDCAETCGQGQVCHQKCSDGCPTGESCSPGTAFVNSCACTPATAPGCPDSCPQGSFCHPDYLICVFPALPTPSESAQNSPSLSCPYGGPTDKDVPQCFDANWNACRPQGTCTAEGAFDGGICAPLDGGASGTTGASSGGSTGYASGSTGGSSGYPTSGGSTSSASATSTSGGSSGGGTTGSSGLGGGSTTSAATGAGSSGGTTAGASGSSGGSASSSSSSSGGCAVSPSTSQAPSALDGGICTSASQASPGLPFSDFGSVAWNANVGGEFASCSSSSDCSCPLACVADPTLQDFAIMPSNFCEQPCTTSSDCDRYDTTCLGGFCTANACSGFTIGGACNARGCGDGTCAYVTFGNLGYVGRVCLESGQATGACAASQVTTGPSYNLCEAGRLCQASDAGSTCEAYCTVPGPSCGTGQSCFPYPATGGEDGICAACLPSGATCNPPGAQAECCSGTCQNNGTCQ